MSNPNQPKEYEFQITRTQGLIGLRIKKEINLSGTNSFKVIGFIEPCMVSQLGYLEIGDEILTIDGKIMKSEDEINIITERIDVDLITIKVRKHSNYDDNDEIFRKYGSRYIQQLTVIETLKTTLRKDHIDIAEATLQLAIIIIECGDIKLAQNYLEEALNNAFGTDIGINNIVALCYCTQAHIAYKIKKYADSRRLLWEAVEIFKKIGETSQLYLLQTYKKLLSVATAQDSAEDYEFTRKKADDLQQIIISSYVSIILIISFYIYPFLLPIPIPPHLHTSPLPLRIISLPL